MATKKSVALTKEQLSTEIAALLESIKRYNAGDIQAMNTLRYADAVVKLRYLRTLLTRFPQKGKQNGHID